MLVWILILGIFLVVAGTSQSTTAFVMDDTGKTDRTDSLHVCETETCINLANKFRKEMNMEADPCDDFYEFACGNYIRNSEIPEDKSMTGKIPVAMNTLLDQLHDTFERGNFESDIRPIQMIKQFYDACMDLDSIESTSERELKSLLKTFGGWPVLEGDTWNATNFDWSETGLMYLKHGIKNNFFVGWEINADFRNNTRRIFHFDQAKLGLPKIYLSQGLENQIVKAYYDYMIHVAVILGADRKRAESELMDSLNFEIALANISLPENELFDFQKLYHPIEFSDLKILYHNYDWTNYMNKMFEGYTKFENNEIINIKVPKFHNAVIELIDNTPKRVQSNYAQWRVIRYLMTALGKKYQNKNFEFEKLLYGQYLPSPRWQICIEHLGVAYSMLDSGFNVAVGSLYVRRLFDKDVKNVITEMIMSIKDSFRNILKTVDWIDDKTRSAALTKLENMIITIAYPEELLQDSILEKYYDNLESMKENFLQDYLLLSKFTNFKEMTKLREPSNRNDWVSHGKVALVDSYYNPLENSMVILAGILQKTIFDKNSPAYINYGGVGFIIAHEITHGFDSTCSGFDKLGNLADWWAEDTKQNFDKKVQCVIDQYNNYTVEEVGLNVNGFMTRGENIADNGGMKTAYYAYENYEKIHGIEPTLPGFSNYTPKQLFWLSAVNFWCWAWKPEALKSHILTESHSPAHYRMLGSLSNIPEFSRDFKCPLNSRMNPTKKCAVW